MNQRIVYANDDGTISIIVPAECGLTIEEIAEKDVPAGKPYKIVSVDDIPTDRTFRNAWEVDVATLTDGVGGEHDMFITDPQHPDYVYTLEDEVAE